MKQWLVAKMLRFSAFAYRASITETMVQAGHDPARVRRLTNREVPLVLAEIERMLAYEASESTILQERLTRRYDLSTAMNEAAQRAIAAKKANGTIREVQPLGSAQQAALEFQEQYLKDLISKS